MKTILITATFLLSFKTFATCEEKSGLPLQLEYPSSTFSTYATFDRFNRLDVFSGGAIVQTYETSPENPTNMASSYSHIWKEKSGWCFSKSLKMTDKPQSCDTKFTDALTLRNKLGDIIGVVVLEGEDVIFKQSKKSFTRNTLDVDPKDDILKLSVNGKETTLKVVTANGEVKDGVATILGDLTNTGRGKNLIPHPIGTKKNYTSDCSEMKVVDNNPVTPVTPSSPPSRPEEDAPKVNSNKRVVAQTILQCENVTVSESYLGEYAINFSAGSFGGGPSIKVNVTAEMVGSECMITASHSKYPEHWKFSFGKNGNNLKGKPILDETKFKWPPECNMSKRYQETFGKCKMPTDQDPRNKCYDLPGGSMTIAHENTTFNKNQLDLFSGGAIIVNYPEEVRPNQYSRIPSDIVFWKTDSNWCMGDKSKKCNDPFKGSQEIKNNNGEIVGLIEKVDDSILFRQVKVPFSKTGAIVDDEKPIMKLSAENNITTMTVLSKDGGSALPGIAKVEGTFDDHAYKDFRKVPLLIGASEDRISDCNGLKKSESAGSTTQKTNTLER